MMVFVFKKKICIFAILSVFCICAAAFSAVTRAELTAPHQLTVAVDAGHGLPDGGAVGVNGTVEQEINLAIAKKLEEVLNAKNICVIMTRTDENGLWTKKSSVREMKIEDMKKRLEIMKSSHADVFITIHMNSYKNSSAEGLRIFYSGKYPDIKPLAENIQSRICDVTGAKTHVVQTAENNLYLLKSPPVPVILAECGFLSNPAEEKKLSDDEYQARIAWALADAVEKYYSLYKNQP